MKKVRSERELLADFRACTNEVERLSYMQDCWDSRARRREEIEAASDEDIARDIERYQSAIESLTEVIVTMYRDEAERRGIVKPCPHCRVIQ